MFIKTLNKFGDKILPWRTPLRTGNQLDNHPFHFTVTIYTVFTRGDCRDRSRDRSPRRSPRVNTPLLYQSALSK